MAEKVKNAVAAILVLVALFLIAGGLFGLWEAICLTQYVGSEDQIAKNLYAARAISCVSLGFLTLGSVVWFGLSKWPPVDSKE